MKNYTAHGQTDRRTDRQTDGRTGETDRRGRCNIYTAHPHDMVHVPAKFQENTSMRF